jgi:hypothetical protein
MKRIVFLSILTATLTINAAAQQPAEQRVALNEPATGLDAKSAPALEARMLTQNLNGSDDSPVTDVKVSIKNITSNFYTYVSGWATFYDASGVRCGDGLFKVDALAPQESVEVDTPGIRLRCSPQTWRIVPTNLTTRTADIAKPAEVVPLATAVEPPRPAPKNFIINIDGQDYPIQIDNPLVLRFGNRNRTIVLKSVP